MKKLNNKGMTIIEILLCFILVTVISGSIYSTVNAFSEKKTEEQAKQKIYTYKNLLTKEIEDDIIKKGLIRVDLQGDHESINKTLGCSSCYDANEDKCCTAYNDASYDKNKFNPNYSTRYIVNFIFRNGQQKTLQIVTQNDRESEHISDNYYVAYGDYSIDETAPNTLAEEAKTVYPIPDLGSTITDNGIKNYDLTISVVNTKVKDGVFYLEMRFEHTLLDQRYGVRITAPINMDSYDKSYD